MNNSPDPPTPLEKVVVSDISLNPSSKFNLSPIASSLISGLPSLLGGGLSALSSFFTNQRNYKRQMDMYYLNREYNSPKSQMQRFREAGLNPNLIYGQSNTSQPMAVGNAQAPNFDFVGSSAVSALNDFRLTDSNNVNRAIGYMNYGLSRVNLAYLSSEKKVLYNNLLNTLENLRLDGDIKTLEKDLKKLAYDNQLEISKSGLDANIDSRDKMVVNLIGNLLEFLGIIDSKETFFNNIFK